MRTLIAGSFLLVCATAVVAEGQRPANASGDPHGALARMAGDWEAQAAFWTWADPAAPPMKATATVRARMIMDGRFLFQNVEGEFMGEPLEAIGVIGYDNATARYQAASFDNTGTSISLHVGEMNDAGEIVLHRSYDDQVTGGTVDRRTVRTRVSDDEWVETAYETRSGVERKVMEIRARRAAKGER